MKLVMPVSVMTRERPPAPFLIWGPQAAVRWAALKGFDFGKPYIARWDDPDSPSAFIFQHSDYGTLELPHVTARPEHIQREREREAEEVQRR